MTNRQKHEYYSWSAATNFRCRMNGKKYLKVDFFKCCKPYLYVPSYDGRWQKKATPKKDQ